MISRFKRIYKKYILNIYLFLKISKRSQSKIDLQIENFIIIFNLNTIDIYCLTTIDDKIRFSTNKKKFNNSN